jgi:hypothetical protein
VRGNKNSFIRIPDKTSKFLAQYSHLNPDFLLSDPHVKFDDTNLLPHGASYGSIINSKGFFDLNQCFI